MLQAPNRCDYLLVQRLDFASSPRSGTRWVFQKQISASRTPFHLVGAPGTLLILQVTVWGPSNAVDQDKAHLIILSGAWTWSQADQVQILVLPLIG